MPKVLIADDAEINRSLLKEIFKSRYEILEAVDGEETIEIIKQETNKKNNKKDKNDDNNKLQNELVLIFLDLVMPKKSGMDVLEYMKNEGLLEKIPVIMITGEATAQSDEKAYEYGVADIIYKPVVERVVIRRALNIIELYQQRNNMKEMLVNKNRALIESQAKLEKNNEFLINALSSVVEFRSLESGEHIKRVSTFTRIMLETWVRLHPECTYTKDDIDQMVSASALHDIGKIGIPDKILLKPGRLTPEEFEIMKTHTTIGCDILDRFKMEDSDFFKYCWDICRYHHERYDGKGYPDGKKGDEIPLWAQVVSVVDVYDALISKRVYKQAYDVEHAIKMIYDGECGVFSPEILECFTAARDDILKWTLKENDVNNKEVS